VGGAGAMGGIDGGDSLKSGVEQAADDLAEAVAAVAHWEQYETVLGTRLPPTPRDGFCRPAGAQRAFKLIGDDEDTEAPRTNHLSNSGWFFWPPASRFARYRPLGYAPASRSATGQMGRDERHRICVHDH
jgi:hypothetical protein